MTKPLTGLAAAATLLAGSFAPAGATVTPAWVSTATGAMPLVRNVTNLGALPAATKLNITVGLKINKQAADAYLAHITTPGDALYGKYLTPAQFTAAFSPSASSANAVVSYLSAQGLSGITLAPNRQLVTATGTVAAIDRAFNTQINSYRTGTQSFYANATVAQVPAALGNTVLAVLGIDSLGTMHTQLAKQTYPVIAGAKRVAAGNAGPGDTSTCTGIPPSGFFLNPAFFTQFGLPAPPVTGTTFPTLPVTTPSQVSNYCLLANLGPLGYQRVYDATNAPTGSATNVAVIAEGNLVPQVVPNDLRTFEKLNHLGQVSYTVVPTAAASTLTDTSGQDEFDLDTQYSTGMAGMVKNLYVYDGPSLDDGDLATEDNHWVTDDVAPTASESIGGCEALEAVTGGIALTDNVLLEAAAQGQSLFVSTGDEGSACAVVENTGYPIGVQSVEYPSSSPYVVAVGGTSLIPSSSVGYNYEVSWIGGGGGVSYFEPSPIWQYNSGVYSANIDHRGVPDIAMPADPNNGGAAVIVDGAQSGVGGTSLAAPLSNGAWARLMSGHKNALGLAAPALYRVYAVGTKNPQQPSDAKSSRILGGYHDIYLGSNGLYSALPDYDFTTGMGSLDVGLLENLL